MKKIIILLFCASLLTAGSAFASSESVTVVSYAGDVKITPSGKDEPLECKPDMILKEGTHISTGEESYLEVAFNRSKTNVVKIKENSKVVLKLEGDEKIELIDGAVYTMLKDLKKGETFQVRTPCAVCGARGTGWATGTDGNSTNIGVFDKKVFVRGLKKDGSVREKVSWVSEGFEFNIKKFASLGKKKKMSREKLNELRKEFGMGESKGKKGKLEGFGNAGNQRERQMEGILDRKDTEKRDKMLDKPTSSTGAREKP